jgi:hypothetical protein
MVSGLVQTTGMVETAGVGEVVIIDVGLVTGTLAAGLALPDAVGVTTAAAATPPVGHTTVTVPASPPPLSFDITAAIVTTATNRPMHTKPNVRTSALNCDTLGAAVLPFSMSRCISAWFNPSVTGPGPISIVLHE